MSYMLLMEQYDPEHKQRTLAYVNSKNSAIENARLFADRRAPLNDPELKRLASDIKREVHGDYFCQILLKRVWHIILDTFLPLSEVESKSYLKMENYNYVLYKYVD